MNLLVFPTHLTTVGAKPVLVKAKGEFSKTKHTVLMYLPEAFGLKQNMATMMHRLSKPKKKAHL
jgi:hypothetical protein